ncbi:MAG: hypothetical protein R6X21_08570 [Candidatus Aminicenantes bacterium]
MISEKTAPYRVIPLKPFRRTQGVRFHLFPMEELPKIDAIDRVIHDGGAVSPGPVGQVARPWYMHRNQEDHLIVLHGSREVELFWPPYGRVDRYRISADRIEKDGVTVHEGAGILAWDTDVFHRIRSDDRLGSASLNVAVRDQGFDIATNFSIYELDTASGSFKVLREGWLDQNDVS